MSACARQRGDEERLFTELHPWLLRVVRRQTGAPDAVVEDACAFAWMQLLRCQPERRPELPGWLRVVAVRQAVRLMARERRELPLACPREDGAPEPLEPDGGDDQDLLRAREVLGAVAALPERKRRIFGLFLAGHSYAEVAAQTGDSRRTVERQIMRSYRSLRERLDGG